MKKNSILVKSLIITTLFTNNLIECANHIIDSWTNIIHAVLQHDNDPLISLCILKKINWTSYKSLDQFLSAVGKDLQRINLTKDNHLLFTVLNSPFVKSLQRIDTLIQFSYRDDPRQPWSIPRFIFEAGGETALFKLKNYLQLLSSKSGVEHRMIALMCKCNQYFNFYQACYFGFDARFYL